MIRLLSNKWIIFIDFFQGYLTRENLKLLVYSLNLYELDKIDLFKGNIESIDQFTFRGITE